MSLFIGNIIALIASIIMVYSGYIKDKKEILYAQTIQIGLSVVSNFILGGITGAIINILCCIRNILCYKDKLDTKAKAIIIVLAVGLSLKFNNAGIIGLFPLVSTVIYILFMNVKDVIKFKYLIIFSMVMWLVYDLYIKSYTSSIFDFMSAVANVVSIIQLKMKEKDKLKNENI